MFVVCNVCDAQKWLDARGTCICGVVCSLSSGWVPCRHTAVRHEPDADREDEQVQGASQDFSLHTSLSDSLQALWVPRWCWRRRQCAERSCFVAAACQPVHHHRHTGRQYCAHARPQSHTLLQVRNNITQNVRHKNSASRMQAENEMLKQRDGKRREELDAMQAGARTLREQAESERAAAAGACSDSSQWTVSNATGNFLSSRLHVLCGSSAASQASARTLRELAESERAAAAGVRPDCTCCTR